MDKKNKICMVCDGRTIQFESKYSVKEIVTKIEEEKMYETDSFIEVGEEVYVNPYSVSLVEELKQDNQIVVNIGNEELGKVTLDAINNALEQASVSLLNI
ncbi:MAG: hypothetical protein ACLUG2_04465 [Clostridium perfringens]|uniref:hypothetical protein n=1 Tax=Clostridium perfringens TaxID=1502 RepID=UPI0024487EFF|nr:hypothetical protein [Clostridium perfringens]MDH2460248.1 hypothetical protein [Clostridium perfringens]MDU1475388.1 hypothetical protein [Clostridium perfringens]MDU2828182.1 hypothetical protein [Clostridium perfringens]